MDRVIAKPVSAEALLEQLAGLTRSARPARVTAPAASPVAPRPAASVLLVRPGRACPVEVYMIRRQKSMRFLGGFYAFPGGKVEAADGSEAALARCRGVSSATALRRLPARPTACRRSPSG